MPTTIAAIAVTTCGGLSEWKVQEKEHEIRFAWFSFFPSVIPVVLYRGLYRGLLQWLLRLMLGV